ncbi:hypothetical protein [Paraburkholderia caribensis]|uniref:hypothetical protein n=1 Tax=Paraburkholderia caribensis TaxID=75105 RepID=UPI0031CECEF7
MEFIPLNRRFYEWHDESRDPALHLRFSSPESGLTWQDLHQRRRVVILAEAGSGKSVELIHQAQELSAAGKFAFYATVQDVAHRGLNRALRRADQERLAAWKAGDQPAWFFIDSIDEAKLDNVRLESALREIADGIFEHERRAHIVLSGRHTDWEFARDARRLQDELPIPSDESAEPPPTLRTLIRRILRSEKRPEATPVEKPLVVVMAPLDDIQIGVYAAAKEVVDTTRFVAAIHSGNLQDIARRPLDLDWLVRYWIEHNQFGNFAQVVEASLLERLREPDPERNRRDRLSVDRAMSGLERIGASLVLGRKSTIAVPDAEVPSTDNLDALTVDSALPDWPGDDRQLLLNRPVFDPATFGRARLHNDNEGVIRAFLTARWLLRLRQQNLSARRLLNLLFTESYGVKLVRPSMAETAAWLSLWDNAVAKEVIERAPFLLLTAGDPSTLPATLRAEALRALVARIRNDEEIPRLDNSSLTRFAQPDIVATLRSLWTSDAQHADIRALLLRLIWLGVLRDCADLAEAAYAHYEDRTSLILAGRALMATGNVQQRAAYAERVKRESATLPASLVREAVDELFPVEISVDDLLAICANVDLEDQTSGGFDIYWHDDELMRKLADTANLERLIHGLIALRGEQTPGRAEEPLEKQDDKFSSLLAAAAFRLLVLSRADEAPLAAIDAVLHLGVGRDEWRRNLGTHHQPAITQLHKSALRRRAAFWRAADRLSDGKALYGHSLTSVQQMDFAGWPPGLVLEDIDWLLADGPSRVREDAQRLAADAALSLWAKAGRPPALLARIEAAANSSAAMNAIVDNWLRPPERPAELLQSEAEFQAAKAQHEARDAEMEQSWVDFIDSVRTDPTPLGNLNPPSSDGVDTRLVHLWQLLSEASRENSRFAIANIAPLVDLIGPEAGRAFAREMSRMWRGWTPVPRSARKPESRNNIGRLDCMGITGVSIEASGDPSWASRLTEAEAVRATEYAMLELNGLPDWIHDLAQAWPSEVQRVLSTELIADLDNNTSTDAHRPALDYIDRAGADIARLLAPTMWREIRARELLTPNALEPALSILRQGMPESSHQKVYDLAIARFRAASSPRIAALYLGLACALDAPRATDALIAKLNELNGPDGTTLVLWVLPEIFGSRFSPVPGNAVRLDLPTLERLVILAYRTVRVEHDNDRANGNAYSPDERDHAEQARSAAFNRLVQTPGRPAFDAIMRLIDVHDFPTPPSRLRALAYERAAVDSELTAWTPDDVVQFEEQSEREPRTGRELQLLVIQRLEDLQHELLHGDFAQGATLSALRPEAVVQSWIADRMRLAQGQSYSVEREPETVAAKKPDIVFTARASAAKVPTEIKVAESWTVDQLEAALATQLCGQYLRSADCRDGILILVHQDPRPLGWESPEGTYMTFTEVAQHLREFATKIRQQTPSGPQPELVVIDVSSCAAPITPKSDKKQTRSRKVKPGDTASETDAR